MGFAFRNGSCTDGVTGAFSGAALASQALSELSQTTTQEATRRTLNSISYRREQEEQHCPSGFSRVGGTCERNAPAASSTSRAIPAPARATGGAHRKADKTKAHAAKASRAPAYLEKIAPKDRPAPPPTIPLPEPSIRLGGWSQLFGDYEKRSGIGVTSILCCQTAAATAVPLGLTVNSETATVGFQFGGDVTARDLLFAGDGAIAGVLVGYVSSNITLRTSSISTDTSIIGHGFGRLEANLSGPETGVYTTYFSNGFSADILVKFDLLTLNETSKELLAFSADCTCEKAPGNTSPFFHSASVALTNTTLAGNLSYRFDLLQNLWLEPTVGAQYTNSSYGLGASDIGLGDGYLAMVQGGARVGTVFHPREGVSLTTTLTGLAYDDVAVRGGFVPGGNSRTTDILAAADEGRVRGRGVLAFNLDFGNGISSFVQGEARGGERLFGAGGKAGIRLQW